MTEGFSALASTVSHKQKSLSQRHSLAEAERQQQSPTQLR